MFQDKFAADSSARMQKKLVEVSMTGDAVAARLKALGANRTYHIRNIDGIVADQLDLQAAASIRTAEGAAMVFDRVMDLLIRRLELLAGGNSHYDRGAG